MTSLRKPERSQWCLWGCVINISHQRGLRDLQISPLPDVSEKLHETSQRCVWDASMPAGKLNQAFKFGQLIEYKTRNIFLEKSWCWLVEKLVPNSFLKNQSWVFLLINSVKFYAVCFDCMSKSMSIELYWI